MLKALGAPESARIYWAGGDPFGGKDALLPLTAEFPHFYNKEDLARPGELAPFANRASFMAAIDFIVCEKSDVFLASHGGNMGHAIQVYLLISRLSLLGSFFRVILSLDHSCLHRFQVQLHKHRRPHTYTNFKVCSIYLQGVLEPRVLLVATSLSFLIRV